MRPMQPWHLSWCIYILTLTSDSTYQLLEINYSDLLVTPYQRIPVPVPLSPYLSLYLRGGDIICLIHTHGSQASRVYATQIQFTWNADVSSCMQVSLWGTDRETILDGVPYESLMS